MFNTKEYKPFVSTEEMKAAIYNLKNLPTEKQHFYAQFESFFKSIYAVIRNVERPSGSLLSRKVKTVKKLFLYNPIANVTKEYDAGENPAFVYAAEYTNSFPGVSTFRDVIGFRKKTTLRYVAHEDINGAYVFRFFTASVVMKKNDTSYDGMAFFPHEYFRVCFKDDEVWREDLDGNLSPENLGVIFKLPNYANIFTVEQFKEIIDQGGKFHAYGRPMYPNNHICINTVSLGETADKYELIKHANVSTGFREFAYIWMKAHKRQFFYKGTPECVKELVRNKLTFNPAYFMPDSQFTASPEGFVYSNGGGAYTFVILKDKVRVFRWNNIKEEYSEVPMTNRALLFTPNALLLSPAVFKGTCLERGEKKVRNLLNAENALKNIRSYSLYNVMLADRYLFVEQAAKIDERVYRFVSDAIELFEHDNKLPKGVSRDTNIKDFLMVSGKNVKRVADILYSEVPGGYTTKDTLYALRSKTLKKIYPEDRRRVLAARLYGAITHRVIKPIYLKDMAKYEKTVNVLAKGEFRNDLFNMYLDYTVMNIWYKDLVNSLEDAHDMASFPDYVKPSRLKLVHDRLKYALDLLQSESAIKPYNDSIIAVKKKYSKKLEYKDSAYQMVLPEDAYDIVREGTIMGHCVGRAGYIEMMAKGETVILFLRKNSNPSEPFLTIELRAGSIVQCYGHHDSINTDEKAAQFIKNYVKSNGFSVSCRIMRDEKSNESLDF